eukprot:Unigene5494_Nuclearia_a/m.16815 Unigene5494_Nuclearia_a/g.16815  ORF Unigene5494_Nuclearia_a/g.16815 Unigene5494_Nuclearia_a/m.16815 type:complete len:595 (+) Unigene5494_Nuclearia_a:329-2113(+)
MSVFTSSPARYLVHPRSVTTSPIASRNVRKRPSMPTFANISSSVVWPGRACSTPNLKLTLSCRSSVLSSAGGSAGSAHGTRWPMNRSSLRASRMSSRGGGRALAQHRAVISSVISRCCMPCGARKSTWHTTRPLSDGCGSYRSDSDKGPSGDSAARNSRCAVDGTNLVRYSATAFSSASMYSVSGLLTNGVWSSTRNLATSMLIARERRPRRGAAASLPSPDCCDLTDSGELSASRSARSLANSARNCSLAPSTTSTAFSPSSLMLIARERRLRYIVAELCASSFSIIVSSGPGSAPAPTAVACGAEADASAGSLVCLKSRNMSERRTTWLRLLENDFLTSPAAGAPAAPPVRSSGCSSIVSWSSLSRSFDRFFISEVRFCLSSARRSSSALRRISSRCRSSSSSCLRSSSSRLCSSLRRFSSALRSSSARRCSSLRRSASSALRCSSSRRRSSSARRCSSSRLRSSSLRRSSSRLRSSSAFFLAARSSAARRRCSMAASARLARMACCSSTTASRVCCIRARACFLSIAACSTRAAARCSRNSLRSMCSRYVRWIGTTMLLSISARLTSSTLLILSFRKILVLPNWNMAVLEG